MYLCILPLDDRKLGEASKCLFFALESVKFKTYLGIFNEWCQWAAKGQKVQYILDICFMAYNLNTAVLEESLPAELKTPFGKSQKTYLL